jgi:uncharacterized protein (TIGR02246 family)
MARQKPIEEQIMNIHETAVAQALQTYEKALNDSDVGAVLSLYAEDGVFMPQHSTSSVGIEAIRAAYVAVFGAIRLSVTFAIAEIRQVAPDWIIARTNSSGTVTLHETKQQTSEANQELFVFQRDGDSWKIARYCFCTVNTPK